MQMQDDEIRQLAYRVLIDSCPRKMNEKEIADFIRVEYDKPVSKCMVHNALSGFAQNNEHFNVHGTMYSANKLNPPYAPEIPKKRPIKRLILTDLSFDPAELI